MTFSPGVERLPRSVATGGAPRRHAISSASHDRTARLPRSAWLFESQILTSTGAFRLVFEVVDDDAVLATELREVIAEMSKGLQNLGVARERIDEESFFNDRHRPAADAVRTVEDRFVAADIVRSHGAVDAPDPMCVAPLRDEIALLYGPAIPVT